MDATAAAFEQAGERLAQLDDDWAWLVAQVGPCRIELHPAREPFEALVRAVAYQQLHGRAAEAIVNRLLALFPEQAFPEAQQLLALEDGQLRACGFSARKVQSLLAIARALLHQPHVLLLDEPHTGLDQASCATLNMLLQETHAEGHTLLMTTHQLEHVPMLAQRVVILARGVLAFDAPPERDALALAQTYAGITGESIHA